MILQSLYADGDAIMEQTGHGASTPSMYVPKPLHWIVELDEDGIAWQIRGNFTDGDPNPKGKARLPQPQFKVLPDVKRSSGIRPLLLADSPAYALGWGDDHRRVEKFDAFRQLVHECAEATDNADVRAVSRFLADWNPDAPSLARPPDLLDAHTVTFRVDEKRLFPTDDAAVQKFWAARGRPEVGESDGESENKAAGQMCLLSGAIGNVEEIMPVAVKGIPGGQPTGTHLVSANFEAAESFGLTRAQTSPICRDAGEKFGKALNALLGSQSHKKSVAGNIYVFWCKDGTPDLPAWDADPQKVANLLDAVRNGKRWTDAHIPDSAIFHLFGLSANAARAVVRSALDTTIGEIGRRQADWFTRLRIVGTDGQAGKPLPLKTLSVAAYREFKDVAPGIEDALVQAAFGARPHLPDSLLTALVVRCRLDTENRVTQPRAALLKYLLTQNQTQNEVTHMEHEVTGNAPSDPELPPAYHCGRLFAELEDIQRQALPGINATISDKFFGSASASPASVFGILLSGARDHLSKLRKTNGGAFALSERRLEEICAQIGDFPKTLPLRDQALFSLGYYHHRAARRKDIAERSAAKKQARVTEAIPETTATLSEGASE